MDSVVNGALYGAGLGAALGFVGYVMNGKAPIDPVQLGVEDVEHIRGDSKLVELLYRFKPLSEASREGRDLYEYLVRSCDAMYSYGPSPKGSDLFHINRAFLCAVTAATKLTKQALKSNDLRTAPLMDDVDEVRTLLEARLHNSLLG